MSRWSVSGERLRVELRPLVVTITPRVSFPRSRLLSPQQITVDAPVMGQQSEPWRGSVDALGAALRQRRRVGTRLEVVLSGHFVRYGLCPWSEELVGDGERLAFAKLMFRDVYGPATDTWEVCVDEEPASQASFACAVDRALVSALRDMASSSSARLETVTPALADCVNRHRRLLRKRAFCVAHTEPGRVTLAFHAHKGWQAVRSRRLDSPLSDALPTLLKQEASAASMPDGGLLYLCAPQSSDIAPLSIPGWKVVWLAEGSGPSSTTLQPQLAVARN